MVWQCNEVLPVPLLQLGFTHSLQSLRAVPASSGAISIRHSLLRAIPAAAYGLRHSPLKCTCSSVAIIPPEVYLLWHSHNHRYLKRFLLPPSTGHSPFSSCSHCSSSLSSAAAQNWQWCPAHLPAQAHRCGSYQSFDNMVIRIMFFLSGFQSNNNWQTEFCASKQ